MTTDFDARISRTNTNALKHDSKRAVFGTDDVMPLWVADMDFAAPESVTRALIERASHPVYGYSTVPESLYDALISWIQKRHGWTIERQWIVLAPGVVPSLNATVLALTNPGDGVIVQPPVYFPFFTAASNSGRRLVENPLILDGDHYTIDLDHLEKCAEEARLLILCSPHNPVGRVWHQEELRSILDIADRCGLAVLCDEIHSDLVYPQHHHHVLATLAANPDNIITTVAPSKTFNIPGLGLSAIIVPDAGKRKAIQQMFETLHVSVSNPFSMVAFETAYRDGEPWLEALMAYLAVTRNEVVRFIKEKLPQIRLAAPEGTYLIWLDCRGMDMGDAQLHKFLVEQAKIGLSPGTLFGTGGSGHMRLNIGAPRQVVMEALERLYQAISRTTP